VSVYVATSLDGFVARTDGSLDWLDEANSAVPENEDCGFRAFMELVDVLVMGRKTYEKVLSFGQWPYGETPVVVLSRNRISFPPGLPDIVTHSAETPEELLKRFSGGGVRHIYIDGANTIQRFLAKDLVDEITVTIIPVILGNGLPLFAPTADDIRLAHMHTTVYDFGYIQTTYAVKNVLRPS
jgi:dihydrofolate reductase